MAEQTPMLLQGNRSHDNDGGAMSVVDVAEQLYDKQITVINVDKGSAEGADDLQADPILQAFEQRLSFVWQRARVAGYWHVCSQFLCMLLALAFYLNTGAFWSMADHFSRWDLCLVLFLSIVNIPHIAISLCFFVRLLGRAFTYCTQDSVQFNHSIVHAPSSTFKWNKFCWAEVVFVICPSLVMEAIGIFFSVHSLLRLLYCSFFLTHLLMFSHLVSLVRASVALSSKCPAEQGILEYFNYVSDKWRYFGSMAEVCATEDEFFRFAFRMLGVQCWSARHEQTATEATEKHRMLIVYTYAHKKGVHFVRTYMDAEDKFEQLAAVSMVGFWADKDVWAGVGRVQPKLVLPEELYMKLKQKSGGKGEVGRAASRSLDALRAL